MDKASRGAAALNEGRLDDAIKEYTAAIIENPLAPDYFIKRSTAYQRASPPQYDAALKDAETAVVLAHRRAKRELIGQAQLRRAIVLYCLERYGDSEFILGVVKRLNGSEKTLPIWENKVKQKKSKLAEGDEKAMVTVKELPVIEQKEDTVKDKTKDTEKLSSTVSASSKAPEQTPPNKIKHDWYQSSDKVYFTLLAKGVPKEQATVQMSSSSINISFPTVTGSTFEYALDPLFAAITPTESKYTITPTKVEVILQKATPGQKWSKLEGTEITSAPAQSSTSSSSDTMKRAVLASTTKAPAYPTSSKSGPKDWDAVARDLSRKPKQNTEGTSQGEEWEDEDLDMEGDPASAFFKKLYKNADDDTKRAMMKSYSESGGTVLSTNWSEVGSKRVDAQPPDGMEAKQWSE